MDARKEQVLALLQKNARLSYAQLAERLQLAEAEVKSFVEQAEQDHLIHGYYAVVHDSAFKRPHVRALIEVNVQPERDTGFDRIARCLAKFPEVTDVTLVSGGYDLLLTVVGETLQEVADFVASKLAPMEGVRSTRTMFVLRKYKESGFEFEKEEQYERLRVTP